MHLLDIRTIFASHMIMSTLCATVLYSVWLRNRDRWAGMGWWVANQVMQTAAILLIVLRGAIPDFVSIVVANVLVYAGVALLIHGLTLFVGRPPRYWPNVILLGIFTVLQTYFTYVDQSLAARNVLGSAMLVALAAQAAALMLWGVAPEMRRLTRMVGVAFAAIAATSALRILVDLWVHPAGSLFDSPWTAAVFLMANQLLAVAVAFTLVLLVNRRLLATLELDIEARESAEKALRKSEQKFSAAFQTIPDAVLIAKLEKGELVEVNESFSRVVGYPKEDVLGRSTLELGLWECPSDRERFVTLLEEEGRVDRLEARFRRANGEVFSVELSAEAMQIDDTPCVLTVVRDVEEAHRAKAELVARTDDLIRSNRDLEQFAYVASHDLQEPLRMVINYTHLLQRRYAGQFDSDADDFMEFAVDGANRMSALITELLEYARVDSQGRPMAASDLAEVFEGVLRSMGSTIKDSRAVITHDALPQALCDPSQIGQVLQNLLGNSIKFRGEEPPQIHVGCRREADTLIISVRDNGIGIDPHYFDQIFQIYRRLQPRTEYPGMGMGLAICQKIIERHGQRFWVESGVGEGATFFFTLDAHAQ